MATGKQDSQAPKGLTQAEEALYKILQTVSKKSIIGESIHVAISKGPETFRRMIKELEEQRKDAPVLTEKIIGKDGIEALKNLGGNLSS
jgi:hypothetical protein